MKKLFFIFALLFFFINNSHAQTPYFKSIKSDDDLIYVANRCSAVFNFVLSKIILEPNMRNTSDTYLKLSSSFLKLSILVENKQNRTPLKQAQSNQEKQMMSLEKKYRADSKYYLKKNGEYLSGVIKEDLILCTNLAKTLLSTYPTIFKGL